MGIFYVSRKNTRVEKLEVKFFLHFFNVFTDSGEEGKGWLGPLDGNRPRAPKQYPWFPPRTSSHFLLRESERKSR